MGGKGHCSASTAREYVCVCLLEGNEGRSDVVQVTLVVLVVWLIRRRQMNGRQRKRDANDNDEAGNSKCTGRAASHPHHRRRCIDGCRLVAWRHFNFQFQHFLNGTAAATSAPPVFGITVIDYIIIANLEAAVVRADFTDSSLFAREAIQ